MVQLPHWSEDKQQHFDSWIKTRPESIQELAAKYPPNKLYVYKPTGHRVYLEGYSEAGTVIVIVSGDYNKVVMERRVFGILPEELMDCESLPSPDEVGVVETPEVKQFVNTLRQRHNADNN